MTQTLKESSAAIGWVISVWEIFKQNKSYIQSNLFERVKIRLPGVESKLITEYAVCLFFAEKVCWMDKWNLLLVLSPWVNIIGVASFPFKYLWLAFWVRTVEVFYDNEDVYDKNIMEVTHPMTNLKSHLGMHAVTAPKFAYKMLFSLLFFICFTS